MSKLRHNYERNRDSFLKQMADLGVTVEYVTERREQITPTIAIVNGRAEIRREA